MLPRGPAQRFFSSFFVAVAVASGIWTHLAVGGETAGEASLLPAKVATVRSDHCWQWSACSTSCCTSGGKRRRQEMLFQSSDHQRTVPNCFGRGRDFSLSFAPPPCFFFFFFLPSGASAVVCRIWNTCLFLLVSWLSGGEDTVLEATDLKRSTLGFFFFRLAFLFFCFLAHWAMQLGRTLPSIRIQHPSDTLSLLSSVKSCASLFTLRLPPCSRRRHQRRRFTEAGGETDKDPHYA